MTYETRLADGWCDGSTAMALIAVSGLARHVFLQSLIAETENNRVGHRQAAEQTAASPGRAVRPRTMLMGAN